MFQNMNNNAFLVRGLDQLRMFMCCTRGRKQDAVQQQLEGDILSETIFCLCARRRSLNLEYHGLQPPVFLSEGPRGKHVRKTEFMCDVRCSQLLTPTTDRWRTPGRIQSTRLQTSTAASGWHYLLQKVGHWQGESGEAITGEADPKRRLATSPMDAQGGRRPCGWLQTFLHE